MPCIEYRTEERKNKEKTEKEKTPFRRAGRGALFQTELELVDDVGRDQPGIVLVRGESAAIRREVPAVRGAAVRGMIPAHFQAAENVFPEVILHRPGEREHFGWPPAAC